MTTQHDPRVERGMAAQFKLRQTRLDAGENPIGWKVGFGAPAALEKFQLSAALVGFLTDSTVLGSGAVVAVGEWKNPALEPEIAIHLRSDLPGGSDRAAARAAIGALGPAFELADVHPLPEDVEAMLAGNIFNRHVILGRADEARAGGGVEGLVGRVRRDGAEMAAVTDLLALTGDLADVARNVADTVAANGEMLRAGDVIIAGSIIPPVMIGETMEISYTLEPGDTVTVRVER